VATSIAVDGNANLLLAGVTQGTVNFGGMDIPSPGLAAPFLVKLTSAGKHLWSHGYGDPASGKIVNPMVGVDPKTQQVILGFGFEGTVDLGKGKLTAAPGAQGFVVARFDP
jgi:hypothetical protein